MAKKVVSLPGVATTLFAVICFSFFYFIYPQDLFLKEQIVGFSYTSESFISYLSKPAWLACWLSDSLMHFFIPMNGGAFLLTGVLLLEWWLLILILRRFNVGEMSALYAFIPIMLEWGGYCNSDYGMTSILSLIIALSVFLGYTHIKGDRGTMLLGLLSLPLIYSLAGSRLYIMVILVLLYEAEKNKKRWIYWFFLLFVGMMLPEFLQGIYSLTEEQAYRYPHISIFAFFPAILFCFSILLLQIKKLGGMKVNTLSVSVTTLMLLFLLTVSVISQADF